MVDFSVTSPWYGSSQIENESPTLHRDHDRLLPITNISRIMRKGIPQNGKITRDSKEFVQECVSDFINFITSEAIDKCQKEKRRTITGDDLLWAMSILGFEHYINPLKGHLLKYKEGDNKGSSKCAGGSAIKIEDDGLAFSVQLVHQSSYSKDVNYANSQEELVSMQGSE